MKKTTILIWGLLLTISIVTAQIVEGLADDQKKEYNRRKLTVEKVTEETGGMGWYWTFFSKKVDTWRVFKGLDNLIAAEEFFRLTGYDEEADRVKKRLEDANSKTSLGAVLYVGGLIAMIIPKTETTHYEYLGDIEEITYPYVLPGLIASFGGIYFWYQGMLMKLKPVAPYQTASEIADEYNKKLIAEILR